MRAVHNFLVDIYTLSLHGTSSLLGIFEQTLFYDTLIETTDEQVRLEHLNILSYDRWT